MSLQPAGLQYLDRLASGQDWQGSRGFCPLSKKKEECRGIGGADATSQHPRDTDYCSSTPAFLTSFAYFTNSLRKYCAAASGVPGLMVLPCLAMASFTSGVA